MSRLTKVKRNLECVIEPDKLRDYSKELSSIVKKIEGFKAEKTAFNKRIGSDIAANEAKRLELADPVFTGKEQRSIDCKVVYHFDRKEKKIIRIDTNELVETDIITEEELQENLNLQDKKAKTNCDFRNKEMSEDQCYRCFKKNEHDPESKSKVDCRDKHYKKGEKDAKEVEKKDGKKEEKKPEEKTEK